MTLTQEDRDILNHCLANEPFSWVNFVDRFLAVVVQVIDLTAQSRSIELNESQREHLASIVFEALRQDDFALLRRFSGKSSLNTYLTVVARRLVVKELLNSKEAGTQKPE